MPASKFILETERMILRQFTEADAPLLLELNSDPRVLHYLHEIPLENEAHALQILQTIIFPQYDNKLGRWAMLSKADKNFLGWCGLKYRKELKEIDLGYRLLPGAWGQQYATEAASACLSYGFLHLALSTITARAHIQNLASLRVLEKIGMQYLCEEISDGCPVKKFIAHSPKI